MLRSVCIVSLMLAACLALETERHPRPSIYSAEGLEAIAAAKGTPLQPAASFPTYGNLSLVADGFIWAENLIFDDFDNLWVTDLYLGIVFKITKDAATGAITKTPWLTGFMSLLGLAIGPNTTIFFVGKTSTTGETLNSFDVNIPDVWKIISHTNALGNGLVYVAASDTILSASEAFFAPNEGRVFYVQNAARGTPPVNAPLLQGGLNDCDGLFRNEETNLLYMSEVLTATLYVYNLSTSTSAPQWHAPIATFHAPNMTMLDDMCIVQRIAGTSIQGPSIIAADFWTSKIIAFGIEGAEGTASSAGVTIAAGVANPTSVRRPAKGSVWDNGRNVFITEGGNFFEKVRHVWELTLPAV